jgi:AraC-like DNA-binding protein
MSFPVVVIGISSMNLTTLGYSYAARRDFTVWRFPRAHSSARRYEPFLLSLVLAFLPMKEPYDAAEIFCCQLGCKSCQGRKMKQVAATPVAFVRAMVLAYEMYGKDPGPALRQVQITPELLSLPNGRITASQMEAISGLAMQELDDEALGWFSRRLPWGSYGMLCRASLTSPTLGVALKRWCRHHRLLTDDLVHKLTVTGGVAELVIQETRDLGPMREFCLITSLRFVVGYACWLIDSRIALDETAFAFDSPPHSDVYPLLFSPGPVRFSSDWTGFRFDARYLNLAPRRDEQSMTLMLKRALPLTVLKYSRDRLLAQRTRERLKRGIHSTALLADELNLSVRSLYRQLHEEGTSLQALKDEARLDKAIDLLRRTERPIKQIAQAVGYRSEKSFARAFRSWTGSAPTAYRVSVDQIPKT